MLVDEFLSSESRAIQRLRHVELREPEVGFGKFRFRRHAEKFSWQPLPDEIRAENSLDEVKPFPHAFGESSPLVRLAQHCKPDFTYGAPEKDTRNHPGSQALVSPVRSRVDNQRNCGNIRRIQRGVGEDFSAVQTGWRRERDSNPRYSFPYTRFPSVRLQPLGHLSVCAHSKNASI